MPARLDGTGATAAIVADELCGLLECQRPAPQGRHDAERAALEERNARAAGAHRRGAFGGRRGPGGQSHADRGVTELETRQRRELRRQRTDELRAGLATLAGAYRDRLGPPGRGRPVVWPPLCGAVDRIDRSGRDLQYNPGELLQVQALLTRLGRDAVG